MSEIDLIKAKIKKLYETDPNIHINISMTRPRISKKSVPAIINGIYPNVFTIEESSVGFKRIHSIQYALVLIKQIEIEELK